jgi:hypothetical protein
MGNVGVFEIEKMGAKSKDSVKEFGGKDDEYFDLLVDN